MNTYELIIKKAAERVDDDGDIVIWMKTDGEISIPGNSEFDSIKEISRYAFITGIDIVVK